MSGPLSLVYPVLAHILLAFVLFFLTARARVGALRARRLRIADIAVSNEAWPDEVKKVSNNLHNQFETPLIFYALCGIATYVAATSLLMTLIAWLYVASRVAHSAIHITTNRVRHRFYAFAIGLVALALMWVVIVLRLVAG